LPLAAWLQTSRCSGPPPTPRVRCGNNNHPKPRGVWFVALAPSTRAAQLPFIPSVVVLEPIYHGVALAPVSFHHRQLACFRIRSLGMAPHARSAVSTAMMLFVAAVAAQTVTVTITAPPTASATPSITAVSDCHAHSTVKYVATLGILSRITLTLTGNSWCMVGTEEYPISGPTATEQFQPQYTDCHKHGAKT
jgi:hypothetical protein